MSDKRSFELNSKEDCIIYLNYLMRITMQSLDSYSRYLLELRELIDSNNMMYFDENKEPQIIYGNKFPAHTYEDICAKLGFHAIKLLNASADHTKDAMSYKKFRKEIAEKGFELCDLRSEDGYLLNILKEERDFCCHIPESMLNSLLEIDPDYFNDTFNIPLLTCKYYNSEHFCTLYLNSKQYYTRFLIIFNLMESDYIHLTGMDINLFIDETDVFSNVEIYRMRVAELMNSKSKKYNYNPSDADDFMDILTKPYIHIKK